MIGKIIGVSVTGAVGALLAVFGWLIWKKEKITLLHDYHTDKVAPENRKAFCTLSGIGILVIGIGLESAASFLCFAAAFIAGLALLITAGRKYNT